MAKKTSSSPSPAIIARLAELRNQIDSHNYAYHVLDKPLISDRDFDRLFQELQDLEAQYPEFQVEESPTQRVGGDPLQEFAKIAHRVPMLSLQNSYSLQDIEDFDGRVKKALSST